MKKTGLIVLCALLASCASYSEVLVNAEGKVYQCRHSGWGYIGAPMASANQKKCLKQAQEAGYRPVTQAAP